MKVGGIVGSVLLLLPMIALVMGVLLMGDDAFVLNEEDEAGAAAALS
jgi:hypothetical protein